MPTPNTLLPIREAVAVSHEPRRLSANRRISVVVDMPHAQTWGHERVRQLTYGCTFPVRVGDRVLVPPMPLDAGAGWRTGVVTALEDRSFAGRVRFTAPVEPEARRYMNEKKKD